MYTDNFRIGNFILDRNKEVKIIGILGGGFYIENTDLNLQFNAGDRFSPIPLTGEWLLKFGFIHYEEDRPGIYLSPDYVPFRMFKNGKIQVFGLTFNEHKRAYQLRYVHQLQNLYFAVLNEELNIETL